MVARPSSCMPIAWKRGSRVSCRTPLGCSGRLRLQTARRVRTSRGRRAVTFGSRRFKFGARRRNAVLSIPLSRSERALVTRLRTTLIQASSLVTIGDGALRGRADARFRLYRAARR